jgi:hypothetical protein
MVVDWMVGICSQWMNVSNEGWVSKTAPRAMLRGPGYIRGHGVEGEGYCCWGDRPGRSHYPRALLLLILYSQRFERLFNNQV